MPIHKERLHQFITSEGFRKYFHNTSWLFIGRLINIIVGFLATTYVIRTLGPESYGTLSYIISFAGLGSVIANLGIDQIVTRDIIIEKKARGEMLGTAFVLKVCGAIVALTTIVIASIGAGNTPYITLLIAFLSSSFIFSAFNIINIVFQADVRSKYPTIVSLFVVFILALLKIAAIYAGLPLSALVGVFFLESVLYALGFVYIYCREYGYSAYQFSFNRTRAVRVLKESWPLILSSAFVAVYARIDQIMLGTIIDQKAVGFYDAAVRIAELWYFLPGIITASLFPALVNAHTHDAHAYSIRISRLYSLLFWLAFGITVTIILLAPLIVQILYGPEYGNSIRILQLYVGGTIPIFLISVMNQHLIAEKASRILFSSSLLGMSTNVLLNILLIPSYGVHGAAFATLVSYACIPLTLFLFKKTRRHGIVMLTSIIKFR